MNQTATLAPSTGSGKLASAAGSLLSMVFVLRKSQDLDSHPDLQGKVIQAFEEFRRTARDAGASNQDIEDGSYALAAAFDETMLISQWTGRDQWQADSLAKRYCNNEFVGLGFYDKLAAIRRGSPPRLEVVEIFYYCLVSGFMGKMIETPKEHADLLDELSRELGSSSATLAPNALQKASRLEPLKRFPWIAVILSCVALPFFIWLLTWNILDGRADKIVDVLNTYRF